MSGFQAFPRVGPGLAACALLLMSVPAPAAAGPLILFDSHVTIGYTGASGGVHYYEMRLHSDSYPYREFYIVLDTPKVVHGAEGKVGDHVTFVSAEVLSHPAIPVYFSDDRRAFANMNNRRLLNANMMDTYDPDLAVPFPEDTRDVTFRIGLSHRIDCWEQSRIGYWIGDLRGMIIDDMLFTESDGMPLPILTLDLHPTSCPNPFSYRARGAFPAAVLGGPDLDVTELDPASILLAGVAPERWAIEDVAGPYTGDKPCGCTTAGPDGHPDLTLKFDRPALAAAIGHHDRNTDLDLTLEGAFLDGTLVTGSDCVVIRGGSAGGSMGSEDAPAAAAPPGLSVFAAGGAGDPAAGIGFRLPEAAEVTIRVYDVAGRLVLAPAPAAYAAGEHRVTWTPPASGVYFYRVAAGGRTVSLKHLVRR